VQNALAISAVVTLLFAVADRYRFLHYGNWLKNTLLIYFID
jgi:hypothetical protein